jgi:hypothetical protein
LVNEEDLVNQEEILLEDLDDGPVQDGYDHIHTSAAEFIRFLDQINLMISQHAQGHLPLSAGACLEQ